jgi:hypothetical protein
MKKNERSVVAISLAAATTVVLTPIFFSWFDPFDWGKVTSSRFSWEKFGSVRIGDRIEDVVKLLGDPVWKRRSVTPIIPSPIDPCSSGHCVRYVFSSARWGPTYREGIVVTDGHSRVISILDHQE